jgi:hypothetical protein
VSPVPSLTVTLSVPGIVPPPGELTVTVKFTVTGCPTMDGLGVWAVIVVVVLAALTLCDVAGVDALLVKFVSPA